MERTNDLPNPENMERPNDLPNPENSVSFGDVAEVEVIDHGDAE